MSRLTALGAVVATGLVLATPAGGALDATLAVLPRRPAALERTVVTVRTFALLVREDGTCCAHEPFPARSYPLRVEAVSPTGKTSRIRVTTRVGNVWRGELRFPRPGKWRIQLPQFQKALRVTVGPPVPTPSPAGFGPLGRVGCAPPSPAGLKYGFRTLFGTAVGDQQVWALPFLPEGASWAEPDAAVYDGLVGKGVKIVFVMTERVPPFRAEGPDGAEIAPGWVQSHLGQNWVRIPGRQWGAQFVFPAAGCWRIRAGPRGDVWLLIRS